MSGAEGWAKLRSLLLGGMMGRGKEGSRGMAVGGP